MPDPEESAMILSRSNNKPGWLARALLILSVVHSGSGLANDVPVADSNALIAAINAAAAGDRILLAAGTYPINVNLNCTAAGTAAQPIEVRAVTARSVLLRFANASGITEGFKVSAPHWQFEGLDIEGACIDDSDCEHAFHLTGNADFTILRNNEVRDFNAQLKSNTASQGSGLFPDDVLIERNAFYDTHGRNTANPVTKLDVVGGRRWIVRANTIHDYEKLGGDTVSYAAFLKGNSRDGLFERNLVICERDFAGGVRLGLSFGGGGSSPGGICEYGACTPEHQNGVMRNNLILHCPDVGIYLNSALGTRLEHNTLYDTSGIDVRFSASTAEVRNNLLSGQIRNRDGGSSTQSGNLSQVALASFADWFVNSALADFRLVDGTSFVNQGVAAPLVLDDYCGNDRNDGARDIGAFEYDSDFACITTMGGGLVDTIFADSFDP
jgi:hypothetical protein